MTDTDLEAAYRAALRASDYHTAARLSLALDDLDTQRETRLTSPSALTAAALWYVAQHIAVFPLTPRTKTPFPGTRGFHDATTDPEQILNWWARHPTANIGLPTGHHFDVIDIDGPTGVKSWADIIGDNFVVNELPPILGHVTTPRPGGNHLYVPPVPGRTNRAAIAPGIDYRGHGGYVVAPPSRTDVGVYRWVTPLTLPRDTT